MITRPVLETYVEGVILNALDGLAHFVPDSSDRDGLRDELAAAQLEYDELRHDTEARRRLGHEDWLDTLGAFKAAVDSLKNRLAQVDHRLDAVQHGLTRELYLGLPIEDRRRVLAGFMDCVIVRRSRGRGRNVDPVETRTRILWRGEAPDDLPRKRRANDIRPFDWPEDDVIPGLPTAENRA